MSGKTITGGCLCGALRYEARGAPTFSGFCFCADCRKASGGGSIGFIGFPASGLSVTGPTRPLVSIARSLGASASPSSKADASPYCNCNTSESLFTGSPGFA